MKDCMTANICSRVATRILLHLKSFTANNNEDLYNNIKEIAFEDFVDADKSIVVHASARGEIFKDSRYVGLKTKDAIVDRYRDMFGVRPNVDKDNPDLIINVKVVNDRVDVSLDTSGDSLSLRGYRKTTVMAPLREHLGYGLLKLAGWDKTMNVVDPMCGSGTFVIEAALASLNQYPGLNKTKFQFQKYKGYDEDLFEELCNKYLEEELQETPVRFFGYDVSREAVKAAKDNVRAAGVDDLVTISRSGVDALTAPCETGIVILNPPYGERLDDENLRDVYRDLGFALKNNFKGWQAWVLSGNKELVHLMGLKSSQRIPVWNGPIECRLLKYEIRG
jgi:putative N6-adenine-specific DNA methylase